MRKKFHETKFNDILAEDCAFGMRNEAKHFQSERCCILPMNHTKYKKI